MDEILALIPPGERQAARDRVARLRRDLEGLGDGRLIQRTGAVVAVIAPHLPYRRLWLLVRFALLTVRLDDQLDRRGADPVVLGRVRERIARAVDCHAPAAGQRAADGGSRPVPSDPRAAQAGVRIGVRARGRCTVSHRIGRELLDAVDAGIQHAALSDGRRLTVEEYLDIATRSINYRSFAYALLALTRPAVADEVLDALAPALAHASRAVRLSNDLRSVERDRIAGTVNILVLRRADGSPVTTEDVRREIDRCVRAHHAALARFADGETLKRCLELSVDLYRSTDLR